MNVPIRLLLIEDSEDDAALLLRQLEREGFEPHVSRVETAEEMRLALAQQPWDVVVADHALPRFSAPAALDVLRQHTQDVPFLIVSGSIGEELAVSLIKRGAEDYLLKDRLARLGSAVKHALNQHALRVVARRAQRQLRQRERRFRALIEHNADGLVLFGLDGAILYASPSAAAMLRVPVGSVPSCLFSHVHTDHLPRLTALLAEFASGRITPAAVQFRYGDPNNGWRWLDAVFSNLLAEPSVAGIVCNFRDVTELKELERQEHELRLAREIQHRFFPRLPDLADYDVGGVSYPAAATGGDYFDFFPLGTNGLGVVIGDVSGHGFGPALLMSQARAYLRALAVTFCDNGKRSTDQISPLLALLNRAFFQDTQGDQFLTIGFARLDLQARVLEYVGAGHPEAYVLDAAGNIKARLASLSCPLGVVPEGVFPASPNVALAPGDLLLLCTDGVLEAADSAGTRFGEQRLLNVVRACRGESAAQVAENVYAAVRAFNQNQPQFDDVTVVVIKVR
jgi:PAS domain S-box-containing protein